MSAFPRAADGPPFQPLWGHLSAATPARRDGLWVLQRAVKLAVWCYARAYHRYAVRYHPGMPDGTPYLAVTTHASMLDAPLLMAGDPYDPPTTMVIKQEMLDVPIVGWALRTWGAIGVQRHGRDVRALRDIRRVLAQGRGVAVAPSGTRSADGRIGPMNPVLIRLILDANVPVFPASVVGAFEAMPRGAWLPRPRPVYVEMGSAIELDRFRGRRLSDEELVAAATAIRDALAAIVPDHMRPLPSTPVFERLVLPQKA